MTIRDAESEVPTREVVRNTLLASAGEFVAALQRGTTGPNAPDRQLGRT